MGNSPADAKVRRSLQHAGGERMKKKKAAVGAIVVSAVVLAVLLSAALLPVQAATNPFLSQMLRSCR